MTDKQQPEAFCWATELAMVRDPVTLTVKEAREVSDEMQRMHAENETLRTGYTAARLEIESLRADLRQDPGAYPIPQPAGEYPELPKTQEELQFLLDLARIEGRHTALGEVCAMLAAQPAGAQQPAIMPKGESAAAQLRAMATNYPAGHLWDKLDAKACIRGALEIEALRTSHGQAHQTVDDLCARIKAADDAAADRDYMLDSNDCIAVLRGEWKAPLAMDKPERPSHGQAPAQPDNSAVHLSHCNMGEHVGSCKYGDDDCPALRKAPAQAEPAYKDSTPELHVGDSAFESWYSSYNPTHKGDKQRARDAYAAGMGDSLVMAAPAAVAGPSGYGPKVTVKRGCSDCKACNSESYAVQGDSGHYVYCEHPSLPERKYIGDTRWDTPGWCPAAAPTTQPAPQQEAQWDALLAATSTALEVLQKHRQMKGDWPMGELGRRAAEELQAARYVIFNAARTAQEGK